MELYVAYDDLNGLQFFSDEPDRVDFGSGIEWTGYPVKDLCYEAKKKIMNLEELKSLTTYDDPLKIRVDVKIQIIKKELK